MTTVSPRLRRSPTEMDRKAHKRRKLERQIVFSLLDELISGGYELRIHDGEDWACDRSRNKQILFAAMFATDEEVVRVYKPGDTCYFGSVYLVYRNSGHDVIADNTVNLEDHIVETTKLASKLAERHG